MDTLKIKAYLDIIYRDDHHPYYWPAHYATRTVLGLLQYEAGDNFHGGRVFFDSDYVYIAEYNRLPAHIRNYLDSVIGHTTDLAVRVITWDVWHSLQNYLVATDQQEICSDDYNEEEE